MNKFILKVIALVIVFTGISLTADVPPVVDQIIAIQKTSDNAYEKNIFKNPNKAIRALENANMQLELIKSSYRKPYAKIAAMQIKQNLERIEYSPDYKKVPIEYSETGTWFSHAKNIGGTTIIFKKDGKLLIQCQYFGGSYGTYELKKVEVDGEIHYQTERGEKNNEYYMIEDNNVLNLYGSSRLLDVKIYQTTETNPVHFSGYTKETKLF